MTKSKSFGLSQKTFAGLNCYLKAWSCVQNNASITANNLHHSIQMSTVSICATLLQSPLHSSFYFQISPLWLFCELVVPKGMKKARLEWLAHQRRFGLPWLLVLGPAPKAQQCIGRSLPAVSAVVIFKLTLFCFALMSPTFCFKSDH